MSSFLKISFEKNKGVETKGPEVHVVSVYTANWTNTAKPCTSLQKIQIDFEQEKRYKHCIILYCFNFFYQKNKYIK